LINEDSAIVRNANTIDILVSKLQYSKDIKDCKQAKRSFISWMKCVCARNLDKKKDEIFPVTKLSTKDGKK